jgi:polysaccharide export outer membrane protein
MQAEMTSLRIVAFAVFGALSIPVAAQPGQAETCSRGADSTRERGNPGSVGTTIPPGYVIGSDDLLTIRFWADAQLSADVVVRPDGKISLPLLDDVQAAGFTPEQLNSTLEKAASKYISEPDATVIVREVRSRKVYVLGQVARPSPVPLNTEMNVLQILTAAGGLLEYATRATSLFFASRTAASGGSSSTTTMLSRQERATKYSPATGRYGNRQLVLSNGS